MLWLLPYLGYLFAASAVAGAAGYAAVTQFSVVQRVLVIALDRYLPTIAVQKSGDNEGYILQRNETGVVITGLVLKDDSLQALHTQGMEVMACSLQQIGIVFPSFSRPLEVRVSTVRASIQQQQLPPPTPPQERAKLHRQQRRQDKSRRLEIIEELLWGVDRSLGKGPTRRWNPAGLVVDRLQSKALQKTLGFLVQLVRVDISDVMVHYIQQGEPGPRPPANYLQGADAVVLQARQIVLHPPKRQIPVQSSAGTASNSRSHPPSPEDAHSPRQLDDGAGDSTTWLGILAALRASLWSRIVTDQVTATKLTATGIAVKLRTYPSTWQSYHASLRQQVEASDTARAQSVPFPHTLNEVQERSDAIVGNLAPEIRQRPPVVAERLERDPGDADRRVEDGHTGRRINRAKALQNVDYEEFTLFSQWECSVLLRLVPPGCAKMVEPALRDPGSKPEEPFGTFAPSLRLNHRDAQGLQAPSPFEGQQSRDSLNNPPGANGDVNETQPYYFGMDEEDHEFTAGQRELEHVFSGGFDDVDAETQAFRGSKDSMAHAKRGGGMGEEIYENPTASFVNAAANTRSTLPRGMQYSSTSRPDHGMGAKHADAAGSHTSRSDASTEAKERLTGDVSGMECLVDVSISLKALVPTFSAASVGILTRLMDRQLHMSRFGEHWAVRPQTPVAGNEARWWQHAGNALAAKAAQIVRREVPISHMAQRRASRSEYQPLYAAKHAKNNNYQEPGRRWWQLKRTKPLDEEAQRRLQALEDSLSLEELAHFRFGVAATHNRWFAQSSNLAKFVADKVDALVYTRRDSLPPRMTDLLLHHDRAMEDHAKGSVKFALNLSVACPKLGLAFDVRPSLSAHHTAEQGIPWVVASLHSISAHLEPSGDISVQVTAFQCGSAAVSTAPIDSRLLACPSSVCEQVCKAADFVRYATTGSVFSESAQACVEKCAQVHIKPRYGLGGWAFDDAQQHDPDASSGENDVLASWRPAGYDVEVQLAPLGIIYNEELAAALLAFAEVCDTCKEAQRTWSMAKNTEEPTVPSAASPHRQQEGPIWPPALPRSPESTEDMVVAAFAAAGIPVLGNLALPSNDILIHCPGIALQLPYHHTSRSDIFKSGDAARKTTRRLAKDDGDDPGEVSSAAAPSSMADGGHHHVTLGIARDNNVSGGGSAVDAGDESPSAGSLQYLFTIVLQNIQVRITGEDFGMSLRGGSAQRIEAEGYLDVFSYLSRSSRCIVARQIMPTRVMFDPARRQFTEEVAGIDTLEEQLREIELDSMAKVWAYPEDMPTIMRAIRARNMAAASAADPEAARNSPFPLGEQAALGRWRTYSQGVDAASGLANAMPDLLDNPSHYPLPLLPYLKAGMARGNVVQRLSATPDDPGGAVIAAAASVYGIQAWVSPIHVWHLVSLEAAVRRIVSFAMGSSLMDTSDANVSPTQDTLKREGAIATNAKQVAPRPSYRMVCSLDVDQVSLLCLIGTWTSKGATSGTYNPEGPRYSRAWGITVKRGDPAYLWAQWLAPVYSASLVKMSLAMHTQASGAVAAGGSIDGVLVRDLQLPDVAKHAYVLRPLPARARRLNAWLNDVRRIMLGVTHVPTGRLLWVRAMRKLALRRLTTSEYTHSVLESDVLTVRDAFHAVIFGPQLRVRYKHRPSMADVPTGALPQAELQAEVGQMLAYVRIKEQASLTAFATQIMHISNVISRSKPAAPATAEPAVVHTAVAGRSGGPKLQSSLRMDIVVVGIDMLFRVQSRDLMSLKLQQGRITLDRKAVTRTSSPSDIQLHLSASVQDIMLQDMLAAPEHTLVLVPKSGAEYCSFDAMYTAQVDTRKHAPCLILNVENPRVLLLFRFVADIMDAVDIIGSAVSRTKAAAGQAADTPAAGAAPVQAGGPPKNSEESNVDKPLEVVVQLRNVGIVVPTAATTRKVLAANLEHFMLAIPGSALPSTLLEDVEVPDVDEMVAESLLANNTFKFGGFRDETIHATAGAFVHAAENTAPGVTVGQDGHSGAPTAAGAASAVHTGAAGDQITELHKAVFRRRGLFRKRESSLNEGVLYFEENDEAQTRRQPGVLHVPQDGDKHHENMATDHQHLQDNVLAGPANAAKHVLRGTRRLMEDIVETLEGDRGEGYLGGPRQALTRTPERPESRESTAALVPPRPRVVENPEATISCAGGPALAPMEADADDTKPEMTIIEPSLPEAALALCLEGFEISTGTLIRVPRHFASLNAAETGVRGAPALSGVDGAPSPAANGPSSFCPKSLLSFSWPSQAFDVATRGEFLRPANLSAVQFQRGYGVDKPKASQLHFSATPLSLVLSAPNYTTLMDFIGGNLNDYLQPPGNVETDVATPCEPKEVRFNPSMQFGPPPGIPPTFRLTAAIPRVAAVFEAHPREWTAAEPAWEFASPSEAHLLQPFFSASASNLLLDLGTLPQGDKHINICATSLDMQDLRLGYRLHEVSATLPSDEEIQIDKTVLQPLQRRGATSTTTQEEQPKRGLVQPPSDHEGADIASLSRLKSEETPYVSPYGSSDLDSPAQPSWRSDMDTPQPSLAFQGFVQPRNAAQLLGSTDSTYAQGTPLPWSANPVSQQQQQHAPNTGIKLSVARRLSEHSHRQRNTEDGSALGTRDDDVPTSSPGTHGQPTPGRTTQGGAARRFLPVIDFTELPDGTQGRARVNGEHACMRVLTAPHHPAPEERLPPSGESMELPGSNPNVRLEVSVAMLADSTMAVEIALSSALIQWPYFHDLSLINSLANVFQVPSDDDRAAAGDDVPALKSVQRPASGPASWMYVNAILTEVEIFLPVLDAEVAEHMATELWERSSGLGDRFEVVEEFTPTPTNSRTLPDMLPESSSRQKNTFQRVADMLLAAMLLDSTDSPGALALEGRGLALGAGAVRVACAAGGDGESVVKVDVRDLAAFIRDPRSRVNCVVQPFSCSAEIESRVPEAAEVQELEKLNRAATVIQRQWRKILHQRESQTWGTEKFAATVDLLAGWRQRVGARRRISQHASDGNEQARQWLLVDELVMDVASPHTRALLTSYRRASQDRSHLMFLSHYRAVSSTIVRIKLGALTVRAAFSHIPFWQAAIDGVQRVILAPQAGGLSPSPVPAGATAVGTISSPEKASGCSGHQTPVANAFRPHSMQISASLESASAVLCNDKPETFGAPDVLQVTVCEATLAYDDASMLPDRPANKAARLRMSTYASFLNSGTSRWEPLCDLWPVAADFVDINSAMYLSDRKTNFWFKSDRVLNFTFNPASLLSFGDALSFMNAFNERSMVDDELMQPSAVSQNLLMAIAPSRVGATRTAIAAAARGNSITSRAPQKYLIQNQSGMRLYYWGEMSTRAGASNAAEGAAPSRTPVYTLENGCSETLRVTPVSKRLTFMQTAHAAAGAERLGSVISMHFEGNWMPISDVAVNVVGKYRYTMLSPADNTTVPVVVDIILVGRTKIITLHSGIWVENCIDRPISLRLHVPTTSLVPPTGTLAGRGDSCARGEGAGGNDGSQVKKARSCLTSATPEGDVAIGPLDPTHGCYLPLTAALGGLLFLQPEGFAEAARDVIRLSTDVDDLLDQQGYVSCEPLLSTSGRSVAAGSRENTAPLHVAVEATPSGLQSEFQAFKHMECVASGILQRATRPLEVTLSIRATMIIANALPYEMRVLLWQIPPQEAQSGDEGASADISKGKNPSSKNATLPAVTPGTAHHASLLEMLSPRSGVVVQPPRKSAPGRYYLYRLAPGTEQKVHVDMRQNVLMHVSVEEINMRSIKWSLCSWAQRTQGRETQYAARLPRQVQFRMLGVGMSLPMDPARISDYLLRLKEAGGLLRTVHKQFHKDARAAVTSADIQSAVARVRSFAKRMRKAPSKMVKSALRSKSLSARAEPQVPTVEASVDARPQVTVGGPGTSVRPAAAVVAATNGLNKVTAGGVKKRTSSMIERWARSYPSGAMEEADRPASASTAGTSAPSPERQLMPTTVRQSDVPSPGSAREIELVQQQQQQQHSSLQASAKADATAADVATVSARNPRRPPPLEIAEDTEPQVGGPAGMARTPFDVLYSDAPAPGTFTAADFESELEEEEEAEVRAPQILQVGVFNTLADREVAHAGVCRLTLYVPYWLNNRTGVDLCYKDYTSAPPLPFLFGAVIPGDYGEVFAPGTSMTDAVVADGASDVGSSSTWNRGPAANARNNANNVGDATDVHQAVLEYKLVLMNKQDDLSLGLGYIRRRKYSQPVHIKTVGNKGTVELRGPAAMPAPRQPLVTRQHHRGPLGVPAPGSRRGRAILPTPGPLTGRTSMTRMLGTQPGTMLVELTSSGRITPPMRKLPEITRRPSGSLNKMFTGISERVEEEEVEAALQAMQQLPPPAMHEAKSGLGQSPSSEESAQEPSQATGIAEIAQEQERQQQPDNNQEQHRQEESVAATAEQETPAQTVAGGPAAPPSERQRISRSGPSRSTHQKFFVPMDDQLQEELVAIEASTASRKRHRIPGGTKGLRMFEFAVDVTAGPPDSIYCHTKLITLKPKYIIENQTGLPVDVKQLDVPYPCTEAATEAPAEAERFARTLAPGQRAAVYWDDAELLHELVVRPRPPGEEPDAWHWSGGFPIPDTEWYFGLRIRHRTGPRRYMNIPVNVTVGASGSVQVTLKSPTGVPPYRIENRCKDVQLFFVQVPLVFREQGTLYVDSLNAGESMPYAWDEPTLLPKLRVQARVVTRAAETRVADYALDALGEAPMMMLPTHGEAGGAGTARRLHRTLSNDVPDELKKKLVSLLAAEFSKKVYVSVYADGPTRVLRFSDERAVSSLEQEHIVLDLAARMKQVERQLRMVNAQFARLSGVSGAHAYGLDLYGRMPAARDGNKAGQSTDIQRRASRKLPLPESTQALVHQASRQIPSRHTRATSWSDSPSSSAFEGGTTKRLGRHAPSSMLARAGSPGLVTRERHSVRFDMGSDSGSPGAAATSNPLSRRMENMDDPGRHAAPSSGVLHVPDRHREVDPGPSSFYQPLRVRTGGAEKLEKESEIQAETQEVEFMDVTDRQEALPGTSIRRTRLNDEALRSDATADNEPEPAITVPTTTTSASDSGLGAAMQMSRRQELLRYMADSDAVLLVGGDLAVTVVQAQDLHGQSRSTHAFARIHVADPFPTSHAPEERTKQTSVVWQTSSPAWDEQLSFRDVCAASELMVELWDLGGTKSTAQLNALASNAEEVIKSCRFLGCAEIPLSDTLDVPAGTPVWYPLMRRSAADAVAGRLQLRFLWDVGARGLLSIKLAALERVLAQRQEILAALQPVSPLTALSWIDPDPQVHSLAEELKRTADTGAGNPPDGGINSPSKSGAAAAAAAGFNLFVNGGDASSRGTLLLHPSRVAAEVLAHHADEATSRHLVVTVLEARGLAPRRGVVVALSANELPNPVVTVNLPGYSPYTTPARSHTLAPRWPGDHRHVFHGVDPSNAGLTFTLGDARGGVMHRIVPLGVGTLHASNIQGENPSYIWVPLYSPKRRLAESAVLASRDGGAPPELQLFVRLQWQTEVPRGSSVKVDVDAAGAGLMVVGGLQDELFNLTFDRLRATAVRTRLELTLQAMVNKIQLDNQMMNAVEPVVLAPDIGVKPKGAAPEGPMVTFGFVRSFAGSSIGVDNSTKATSSDVAANDAGEGKANNAGSEGPSVEASSADLVALDSATAGIMPSSISLGDSRGIRSFKNVSLMVAPMDLMTDEAFLEALLSFLNSLPVADIWQDRAWQDQQRRLLNAQFGPREVESLAVNAVVTPPTAPPSIVSGSRDRGSAAQESTLPSALGWVIDKEAKDLEVLHGQSDLSSWFFIESAEIGSVAVKVTVSLTSRLLQAAGSQTASAAAARSNGSFDRTLGASGFQLVNVSNVPIMLGKWMVGTNPSIRGRFSNGFLSQRALASNLTRHYRREAFKEAHKVLGGAGPAVASVPLTVLWAGFSVWTLLRGVTSGTTGPVGAVQQVVYVPLMTFSMFISGFSRMLAAGMVFLPPSRSDGDDATVRRVIRRPNNALEALAGAPRELGWGLRSALEGLALDPIAGWHWLSAPGLVVGVAKAAAGLPVRPLIGGLEFGSNLFAAAALSALGREGIVGKMQRRVRPPGAFADEGIDAIMEDGPRAEAQGQARALQSAWQRVLPEFFPEMEGDSIRDVIHVRSTRVVLITDRHVAYLRARHLRDHSVYKAKWLVPISEVQNIRGDPESWKIVVVHVRRYNLKALGIWPVQKRKGLRCAGRAAYERTVARLTQVQQAVQGGLELEEGRQAERFVGPNVSQLTILARPYEPLPEGTHDNVTALGPVEHAVTQS